MSRVYITQVLCPHRHAILALAAEAPDMSPEDALMFCAGGDAAAQLIADRAITEGQIKPLCFLCQAHRSTWTFETARTMWSTMDEAHPHLQTMQTMLEQTMLAITREHFQRMRKAAFN